MKKFIYISTLFLATALTTVSCKNEEKDLFDQSAAERAETAADNYTKALEADGGKWLMEYFTNDEECGYTYIVTFNTDGTVKFSGKNKWIGGVFKSETSLWDVISDNGPVLTFNSYNTIFHVFSTPENFADPDWSSDHKDDIDEQGYGHKGDYEFMLMEANDDFVRLKGKKYGYTIMLRHLPADTDDAAYLASIDDLKAKMFNDKFTTLVMTDASGEKFVMQAAESETYNNNGRTSCGVYSMYPMAGDKVTQIVTANAIITADGIRFAKEVEIPRADANAEPLKIQTFKYNSENGTLVSEDNSVTITAQPLSTLFADINYKWMIDESQLSGKFVDAFSAASEGMKTVYKGRRNLNGVYFWSAMLNSDMHNTITFYGGSAAGSMFTDVTASDDNTVALTLNGASDSNGSRFTTDVPAMKALIEMLGATTYKLSANSLINPTSIKVTCADNANDYFYVTLQ